MFFVSTWAAFACSLFWLNRLMGRRVFLSIPNWEEGVLWKTELPAVKLGVSVNWKACVLVLCGFVGGIFSAISGRFVCVCVWMDGRPVGGTAKSYGFGLVTSPGGFT